MTSAPRLKALSPRTATPPSTGTRAAASDHGSVLPGGIGNAPVFRISSLSTRSTLSTAQASAMAPPQSWTTSDTGSVRPRPSTNSPKSATRRASVCGYCAADGFSDLPMPMWSGAIARRPSGGRAASSER